MDAGGVKVQETKRAHGLLVALLLSLLLGPGPAAAADVRRPHVETADSGKATLVVRSLKRVSEAADDRDGPVLEPEEPRLVSLRPDVWPSGHRVRRRRQLPFGPLPCPLSSQSASSLVRLKSNDNSTRAPCRTPFGERASCWSEDMSNYSYHLTAVHQKLDERIRREMKRPRPDSILLLRLKKLRLSVKDRLAALRLRSRQPA